MKTQFHPDSTAKRLLQKTFPGWAKTQFDPIKTQLRPNSVMPRHRTLWLVTLRIRRVVGKFADNLPMIKRNLPILAGVFDGTTTNNRPTKSQNRPIRLPR